jgi:hypothetical protein
MTQTTTVVLVPGAAESVRVLRVMAADAAAAADLGFDRFSDLELAIDEASAMLLDTVPQQLRCTLVPSRGRVDAVLEAIDPARPTQPDDLARLVLHAVADPIEFALDLSLPSIRFTVAGG